VAVLAILSWGGGGEGKGGSEFIQQQRDKNEKMDLIHNPDSQSSQLLDRLIKEKKKGGEGFPSSRFPGGAREGGGGGKKKNRAQSPYEFQT